MEGVRLREVDKDYRVHQQAFLNMVVKAKKKVGKDKEKPVYSTFRKFFDYDREIKKARKKESEGKTGFLGSFLRGKNHG